LKVTFPFLAVRVTESTAMAVEAAKVTSIAATSNFFMFLLLLFVGEVRAK
jgi:hypothetical protein